MSLARLSLALVGGVFGGLLAVSFFAMISKPTPYWSPIAFIVSVAGVCAFSEIARRKFPLRGNLLAGCGYSLLSWFVMAAVIAAAWWATLRMEGG